MNAAALIAHDIVPIKTSNTGKEALELMSDYYVQHLPIVNNKQFLGLISEEDILENDVEEPIGSYDLSLIRPFARHTDHIFDLLGQIARLNLTIIPVIDAEDNYLGAVSQQALIHFFAISFSFSEPGSIIVLEISKPDYMLSEIARIVESEGATILNSFITSLPDVNQILVHIKINKQDALRVIAAMERFEYQIRGHYTENEDTDILKDRFESLMNYLNF